MASLSPLFDYQPLNNAGQIVPGGKLWTYESGTTTPKATFKNQAGTVTHTNPITLDPAGRVPGGQLWLGAGEYTLHLTGPLGEEPRTFDDVAVAEAYGSAAALDLSLRDATNAAKASGQLAHNVSLNYVARTVGGALNDSRRSMMWFVTSEAERAAIKAGTSTTDHTALIQSAIAFVGAGELFFGDAGWRWNISATLELVTGGTYTGRAKIRAVNSANLAAMLKATNQTRVVVEGLELDGNADNSGTLDYGLFLSGGSYSTARDLYVHDTRGAGIRMDTVDGSEIEEGYFINCGRLGSTDNHGIMIGSSTGECKNWSVRGTLVIGAYRKGITTYGFGAGTCTDGVISSNRVASCGLGGIYVAGNDSGTVNGAMRIALIGNVATDNYVNFEIDNCSDITCSGNASSFTSSAGKFAGWSIGGAKDISISGGNSVNAPLHGVVIGAASGVLPERVAIRGMLIRNPNQSTAGTGCGVQMTDATNCTIECDISDGSGKMTHGVLESSGCDNNDIGGTVGAGTSARISTTGVSTRVMSRSGRNTGFGVAQPLNTVHIDGGITTKAQALALVNGANQNVALPTKASSLVVSAPTGAYSIGGIAGGHDGMELTLVNYTTFAMTLNHQDGGSTAANRFTLSGGANVAIPSFSAVRIMYSSVVGAWVALR
ncbi:MAG: hypothetical protein ACRCYS_13305 [Beijerinckiaceae bacterium]